MKSHSKGLVYLVVITVVAIIISIILSSVANGQEPIDNRDGMEYRYDEDEASVITENTLVSIQNLQGHRGSTENTLRDKWFHRDSGSYTLMGGVHSEILDSKIFSQGPVPVPENISEVSVPENFSPAGTFEFRGTFEEDSSSLDCQWKVNKRFLRCRVGFSLNPTITGFRQ